MANVPSNNLTKKGAFTIASVNVRSLSRNWNSFITSSVLKADIICIQEIWKIRNINLFNLRGYCKLEYKCREMGYGGGVGIYVRQGIKFEVINSIFVEKTIETLAIKIKLNGRTITIVSVYRNPSLDSHGLNLLSQWLENQQSSVSDSIVIMGDLNINILKNTRLSKNLKQFCATNGLKSHIKEITRVESGTSIDHILTSKLLGLVCKGMVIHEEVADHFIVILELPPLTLNYNNNKLITYRPMSEENIRKLRANLNLVNWRCIDTMDNDQGTEFLIDKIKNAYEM